MRTEVVILGGGVGGTIVANLVAKQTRARRRVTVVDATGIHVYQPGFLYVAVGQEQPSALQRAESQLLRHDVSSSSSTARRVSIPLAHKVVARVGPHAARTTSCVLATGSRTVMGEVPGRAWAPTTSTRWTAPSGCSRRSRRSRAGRS